jgi:hypothetical protein
MPRVAVPSTEGSFHPKGLCGPGKEGELRGAMPINSGPGCPCWLQTMATACL